MHKNGVIYSILVFTRDLNCVYYKESGFYGFPMIYIRSILQNNKKSVSAYKRNVAYLIGIMPQGVTLGHDAPGLGLR